MKPKSLIVTERDAERISRRITINQISGCWTYPTNYKDGYARIKIHNRQSFVHRAAYIYCRGDIPNGLSLDHVVARGCQHRNFCNPYHLEPVTHQENVLRGRSLMALNARKTHCKRGHPFTAENTLILKCGSRACRTCAAERMQAYKDAHGDEIQEHRHQYHLKNLDKNIARGGAWYLSYRVLVAKAQGGA